jgi:hypothetical protein
MSLVFVVYFCLTSQIYNSFQHYQTKKEKSLRPEEAVDRSLHNLESKQPGK